MENKADLAQTYGVMPSIRADSYRRFGICGIRYLLFGFLFKRCFRAIITYRLCQLSRAFAPLHHLTCWLASLELPPRARIGPGLQIAHGFGIVVSHGARIGANVTLFHGVTLGRRDRIGPEGKRDTSFPLIEDEVWIGPHAVIVGGVRIGRGSRIAAGAFVLEDVPPYSVVQGNPAQIVKQGCTPDVNNKAPLL